MQLLRWLLLTPVRIAQLAALAYFCLRAYRIRLHAIKIYGYVIHEFDPWFNYRAAEYLAANGYKEFFQWYDHMSWYPIGRPIGTTIYPGMQIAAVEIWQILKRVPKTKIEMPKEYLSQIPKWVLSYLPYKGKFLSFGPMSLNDVCCMVPPWFGALATFSVFLLASELSESVSAGLFAAAIMAIIPAHLMRSIGGGFDNECVAVSFFCLTLWLWVRCIKTRKSWPIAIPAGVMYAFAASSWGGYIFINNLIGLHAAVIVALGMHTTATYRAYTLYWLIGTIGAMQIPVIGWTPLRSLEQMPSLLVFAGYQLIELCDIYRRRYIKRNKQDISAWRFFFLRAGVWLFAGLAAVGASYVLMQMGFFMPLGARIRGLFLEAVKTGNPLVDSVAEHSPASNDAYEHYLGKPRFLAAIGLLFCWHQKTPGKFMAFIYAVVAYYYSLKMSRLMIICGPIVSVLSGFSVGIVADWCIDQLLGLVSSKGESKKAKPEPLRSGGMGSVFRKLWSILGKIIWPQEASDFIGAKDQFSKNVWFVDRPLRAIIAVVILVNMWNYLIDESKAFIKRCEDTSKQMANPHLMFQAPQRDGSVLMIDDYIRGYEWLKQNTAEDARVMAWWDYGYQITGVANRTSIADGNTWNHEHIASLGCILTSAEKKSHNAMRHLADYVLVWAGGHGDDLGKSPHLARIGNSVFPGHCGDEDPLCTKFSFYQDGSPTPMMAKSFLYKAVSHNEKPGVKLNSKYWREVHTTKHGLMRIYEVLNVSKESKAWVADPANRVCDAPGSWYCVGKYPPALQPMMAKRRNFAQLEDFNKKDGEQSAYSKLIEEQRGSKKKKKNQEL